MNYKTLLIACLVTAVLSASLTRYYYPRVDVQTVETTKDVIKTDIRTVVKVVERPDGSKETVTETVDNTTRTTKDTKSHTEIKQKDWILTVGAKTQLTALEPVYLVVVQRRVLGTVFSGLVADTKGTIGLTIGLEF